MLPSALPADRIGFGLSRSNLVVIRILPPLEAFLHAEAGCLDVFGEMVRPFSPLGVIGQLWWTKLFQG